MAISIAFIALILVTGIIINSGIFWLALNKKIKLVDAIKLTSAANALNKLLLTGSGYATISWKLKKENFPLYKTISSFAVLESFSILPWLIFGLYFGAKLTLRLPLILVGFWAAVSIFLIYKKKKVENVIKNIPVYLKEIKGNIFLIIILALLNMVFGVIYYSLLLETFGFFFPLKDTLRVAAISVTAGYLSPAPSGLGFKEGALVFLLKQQNISLKDALAIALTDRLIVTFFYLVIGLLVGAEVITGAMRERRRCKSGNFT